MHHENPFDHPPSRAASDCDRGRRHRLLLAAGSAACLLACLLAVSSAQPVDAQEPILVKDLWVGSEPVEAESISAWPFGNSVLFDGLDAGRGTELWITDGTTLGTNRLFDVLPGPLSSDIQGGVEANGLFFFAANDGVHGRELWVTDGTAAGTHLLKDICPGSCGIDVIRFFAHDGLAYLFLDDLDALWVSDGTSDGTQRLRNLNSTSSFVFGEPPIRGVDGLVFFEDFELFATDGTPAGTYRVADIRVGSSGSFPDDFRRLGSMLLFSADDGVNGRELWKSDGTAAGTARVAEINPGGDSDPVPIAVLAGELFFSADDGVNGRQLWKTDGTTTTLVSTAPTSVDDEGGVRLQGNVYFQAEDFAGAELWKSDGTSLGTTRVADIHPDGSSSPRDFFALDQRIVFRANDGTHGTELWASNGTSTQLVKDIENGWVSSLDSTFSSDPGFANSAVLTGDRLVFGAGRSRNLNLWVSDGSELGTTLLTAETGPRSSSPEHLVPWAAGVAFTAETADLQQNLHTSDGTATGTVLHDIVASAADGAHSVQGLHAWNGLLFIQKTDDFGLSKELIAWDGASAVEVASSFVFEWFRVELKSADSAVVFTSELVLHRTDGTPVSQFADLAVPDAPLVCTDLETLGDLVIYGGYDALFECELFVIDLADNSSTLLLDLGDTDPRLMGAFGGKVLFRLGLGTSRGHLYATDGTAGGTVALGPTSIGDGSGSVVGGGSTNAGFLFLNDDPDDAEFELWKTDGTAAGTSLVRDLSGEGELRFLAAAPAGIYFHSESGVWFSDGTHAGTMLVAPGVFAPLAPVVHGDNLVVAGIGAAGEGHELHYVRGPIAEVERIPDVQAGAAGSTFEEAVVNGDKLYLSTYRRDVGQELFLVDLLGYATPDVFFADGFESGTVGAWSSATP